MTTKPAPASREAEIAARLAKIQPKQYYIDHELVDDCRYLLAQLQQVRQERDEWKAVLDPLMVQVNQTWRDRSERAEAQLQQAREALMDCFVLLPPERVGLIRPATTDQIVAYRAALNDEGR